jgi:AraC-like DNA-binding protein
VISRDDALTDLARRANENSRYAAHPGELGSTCIPSLTLVTSERATLIEPTCYEPVICLILQGSKEVEFGSHRFRASCGQSIIVSHDLPIRSRIVDASPAQPYSAVVVRLDVGTLRSLADEVKGAPPDNPDHVALEVRTADPQVVDVLHRLVALAGTPADADVLAPLVLTELHYRLLQADHGSMLRRLLSRDSHASRIEGAIARIRADLSEPVSIPQLAHVATMSPSTFHQHFKEVTGTTPLQYQKSLRLLEARRLLRGEGRSVTEAAFDVGYRSSTQFSREYLRTFGVSPQHDRPSRAVAS